MTAITQHTPDALLAAYAAGSLPPVFAMVVASHVSICGECRAALESHHAMGGAVLDTCAESKLSDGFKSNLMAQLDLPMEQAITRPAPQPMAKPHSVYPAPLMELLKNKPPRWRSLGLGMKQAILSADEGGSLRLLHIPAGQAVPDHGHNGMELTLVLQGSFSDETGRFARGDIEVADEDLEHTPVADAGDPCICLAATDAPLRFNSLMPRLFQPIFRI
jgi:putative transcriptional regulator